MLQAALYSIEETSSLPKSEQVVWTIPSWPPKYMLENSTGERKLKLKNAGIEFLYLECNPGSTAPDFPTLFWLQVPDGSKLLTFYWAECYGSGILPPKGWPHKTWLATIHPHENSGAPGSGEVAELLRTAKKKMPDASIKIGRLSDLYDLLMAEKPDLPVVPGDMPDT
jgi:hypothetical protein